MCLPVLTKMVIFDKFITSFQFDFVYWFVNLVDTSHHCREKCLLYTPDVF